MTVDSRIMQHSALNAHLCLHGGRMDGQDIKGSQWRHDHDANQYDK